jgi:hypothetical protein
MRLPKDGSKPPEHSAKTTKYMAKGWLIWSRCIPERPFYALDDPLEAAVFSVLIELLKETDHKAVKKRDDPNIEPSA